MAHCVASAHVYPCHHQQQPGPLQTDSLRMWQKAHPVRSFPPNFYCEREAGRWRAHLEVEVAGLEGGHLGALVKVAHAEHGDLQPGVPRGGRVVRQEALGGGAPVKHVNGMLVPVLHVQSQTGSSRLAVGALQQACSFDSCTWTAKTRLSRAAWSPWSPSKQERVVYGQAMGKPAQHGSWAIPACSSPIYLGCNMCTMLYNTTASCRFNSLWYAKSGMFLRIDVVAPCLMHLAVFKPSQIRHASRTRIFRAGSVPV